MLTIYALAYGPIVCTVAIIGLVLYAGTRDERRVAIAARTKALDEATEALQSLADIAANGAEQRKRDGLPNGRSVTRAYLYQRAANIVASIPEDRI